MLRIKEYFFHLLDYQHYLQEVEGCYWYYYYRYYFYFFIIAWLFFLVKALLLYSYIHVLCAIWLLTYILKYFKYRITCIPLEDCIILLYYWHIAEVKCKMKWNVLTIDRWSVLNYVMVNYEWTCLSNVQRIYCTYWGISCTTCA